MTERSVVVIAMPVHGQLTPETTLSLVLAHGFGISSGIDMAIAMLKSPVVDSARNRLVEQILTTNATHVLWVDSDMVPPHDIVPKLLTWGKPVVSGLAHYKESPYRPALYRLDPFGPIEGRSITDVAQQVEGIGLSCALIEVDVFRKMTNFFGDEEWFRLSSDEGEDVHFCRRLAEMGIPIWLDPSVRVGHMTSVAVGTQDWLEALNDSTKQSDLRRLGVVRPDEN